MFCSKCGAENNDDAKYCGTCGEALNTTPVAEVNSTSTAASVASQTDAERGIALTADYINSTAFNELLGAKAAYYRESFLRIYEVKKRDDADTNQFRIASGFNLWAGFLGPIWLGYRGIYKLAWIFVLIEAFQFRENTSGINYLIAFVANYLVIGFMGNYWYYESLNSKLKQSTDGKPVITSSVGDAVFFVFASIGVSLAFNLLVEYLFAR